MREELVRGLTTSAFLLVVPYFPVVILSDWGLLHGPAWEWSVTISGVLLFHLLFCWVYVWMGKKSRSPVDPRATMGQIRLKSGWVGILHVQPSRAVTALRLSPAGLAAEAVGRSSELEHDGKSERDSMTNIGAHAGHSRQSARVQSSYTSCDSGSGEDGGNMSKALAAIIRAKVGCR